jgi:hypothetical protein
MTTKEIETYTLTTDKSFVTSGRECGEPMELGLLSSACRFTTMLNISRPSRGQRPMTSTTIYKHDLLL